MNRRKFLSRILCLGAIAAIVPKIIPKVFPNSTRVHGKVDGTLYYTDNYNAPQKIDLIRQYPVTPKECLPPKWATDFQWIYPALK